jgi:endonuclease-3 related protein
MVGAVLTQNAAWTNVERAIANLKQSSVLTPGALLSLPVGRLERLIAPSGFFRVKARRLRNFLDYFAGRHAGSVARMRRHPLPRLRQELLAVNGIGPETADSILLYALNKPSFVIDAYTRRILSRHAIIPGNADYDSTKLLFESNLPASVKLYNEFHALLVKLARRHCRVRPVCDDCPLKHLPRRPPPPNSELEASPPGHRDKGSREGIRNRSAARQVNGPNRL